MLIAASWVGPFPWEDVLSARMGLHLADANTAEELGRDGGEVQTPRRTVLLTPIVIVHVATSMEAQLLATELGASALDTFSGVPLELWASEVSAFLLAGEMLTISFLTPHRTTLSVRVSERFAYFLELTGCLSFAIVAPKIGADTSGLDVHVTTITNTAPKLVATVAGHPGSTGDPAIWRIVAHSQKWRAVVPLGGLGVSNLFDEKSFIYYAFATTEFLPQPFERDCLICGTEENLSAEHCVPKWLVDRLGVTPVVATILCAQCNNQFGLEVESHIAPIFAAGLMEEPAHRDTVAFWVVKTAVMLAAAGNVGIPDSVLAAVRTGAIDNSFGIYWGHLSDIEAERFYRFTAIQLRREHIESGHFLMVFETNNFAFCVARLPQVPILPIPYLGMKHPNVRPALDESEITIQDYLLRKMDVRFDVHTPAAGRTPSPRTSCS